MNYIIDGYNVGHNLPEAAQWLKKGETRQAITIILNFILSALNGKDEIIVVFDGQAGPHSVPGSYGPIRIQFSQKPQTADDIIRNFIRSHPKPEQWTVITSDNEILYTAKDMGAQTLTSARFTTRKFVKSNAYEHNEKYNPEQVDVNAWLKLFNGESGA
jgi:predicted RNA-binding protein with PIN domain